MAGGSIAVVRLELVPGMQVTLAARELHPQDIHLTPLDIDGGIAHPGREASESSG